jgi:16S rRNA (guanine527-N7)-methyltransferase
MPNVERLLARQPWDALSEPLRRAGVEPDVALDKLRLYARLLIEWNRGHSNLMSHNDEPRFVERHILESVAPAHLLKESQCRRWVDLGSGGGLPAIPLVIAGVGEHWTLVESRRTKTLFIRKALQELSLRDVETVNDRMENFIVDSARPGKFDGFTSRATQRLGPTLDFAARLVAPGGRAFLWKGSSLEQEMEGEQGWRNDWAFSSSGPIGSGPNVIAVFIRKSD